MSAEMEQLYAARMKRYTTAMRNEKPDMIPIRPFVAEFTAKYAGYTCQEVTQDYQKAFDAARKCAADGTIQGYSILGGFLIDMHPKQATWVRDFIKAN